MKFLLMGLIAFFASGLIMEQIFNSIISQANEMAETPSSQAQFVEAQRSGESIEAPDQNTAFAGKKGLDQLQQANCTAENIAQAHPYMVGTIEDVIDGDTIIVNVEGAYMRVRLWGIDAPEKDQPNGQNAWQNLINRAPLYSKIELHPMDMDQYGRMVANIGYEGKFAVNFDMVAQGMAYHVNAYSSINNRCLIEAQKVAQTNRKGVWQNDENGEIRPWEHRRQQQEIEDQKQIQQQREPEPAVPYN